METGVLDRFERQVTVLLQQYERLKKDNVKLREKQSVLLGEHDALNRNSQSLVDGIKKMIERLKKIEKENSE
jgi:uncharacterized protein (TIGR02449 family)